MNGTVPCLEPACEGHPQVTGVTNGVRFVINKPEVLENPVYEGCGEVDGDGASIYGTVIRDGGVFRMWYQAWPKKKSNSGDTVLVGCLESDDGLDWRRPRHGVMEWAGSRDNHLTNLPFHSPSVVIDPAAGARERYRAFGCTGLDKLRGLPTGFNLPVSARYAFYTAHSPDGLSWTVDGPDPVWPLADVITSAVDPWEGNIMVALKCNSRAVGLKRRRFGTATWTRGGPGKPITALIPDELDDQYAQRKGFESADYYGLGLLPGRRVTIGFLWNFRHQSPLSTSSDNLARWGRIGCVDISLVYQTERSGRWQHLPGRPDWMSTFDMPEWASGALYTASTPIDVGNETWLYFTGTRDRHGWAGDGVELNAFREKHPARIGLARWTRGRLMGYESRLRGVVRLDPEKGCVGYPQLLLNVKTQPGGCVRVELRDGEDKTLPGYTFDDCLPVSGDQPAAEVRWRDGVLRGATTAARAHVELVGATLYGFIFTQ